MSDKVVGVDGCRAGWFAIWHQKHETGFDVYESISDLWRDHQDARQILIDIPIGLTNDCVRMLDSDIRSLLGHRSSSVFPVPSRDAVYASDYESACLINDDLFGKKLSKQSWNICDKIRDVDRFLGSNSVAIGTLGESHPELVFTLLAGRPLSMSKKTAEGIAERLDILCQYDLTIMDVYMKAEDEFPRKILARDDIVDALALTVTGANSSLLGTDHQRGVGDIPIRMHIPAEECLLFSSTFI